MVFLSQASNVSRLCLEVGMRLWSDGSTGMTMLQSRWQPGQRNSLGIIWRIAELQKNFYFLFETFLTLNLFIAKLQ
jgi:hypothetical protein